MNLLLTSFESWGAGSPQSSRRSDSLHTCSTVQQYNAVILHDSYPPGSDLWPPMEYFFYHFHLAFNPRDLYYRGTKKNNNTKLIYGKTNRISVCQSTKEKNLYYCLLLCRRPPCWNKHGSTRRTCRVVSRRDVTTQVELELITMLPE